MAARFTALAAGLALTAALHAQPTPAAPETNGWTSVRGPDSGPLPPTSNTPTVTVPHTPDPCPSDPCPPNAGPAGGGYWASAEYLYWWVRGPRTPALVTTSLPGTPASVAGVLGAPVTAILYGGTRVDEDPRSGLRLAAGMWLDDCRTWGVGVEYFCLQEPSEGFLGGSPGSPILARPFFNTLTGAQDAQLTAFPGLVAGGISVESDSKLWGAGAYCRKVLCGDCRGSVEALVGYRYLDLDERVQVVERLTALAVVPGTQFVLIDTFDARTRFHGADFGLAAHVCYGRCFVDVLGKVAVGCNDREVSMAGATRISFPGLPSETVSGGLLTVGGPARASDQVFAVVPEFRLNVGCQVSDCVRVFVGYTAMAWTNVARAGEQIDTRVNPDQLAPPLVPVPPRALPIRDTTFCLQGLSVGVAFSY